MLAKAAAAGVSGFRELELTTLSHARRLHQLSKQERSVAPAAKRAGARQRTPLANGGGAPEVRAAAAPPPEQAPRSPAHPSHRNGGMAITSGPPSTSHHRGPPTPPPPPPPTPAQSPPPAAADAAADAAATQTGVPAPGAPLFDADAPLSTLDELAAADSYYFDEWRGVDPGGGGSASGGSGGVVGASPGGEPVRRIHLDDLTAAAGGDDWGDGGGGDDGAASPPPLMDLEPGDAVQQQGDDVWHGDGGAESLLARAAAAAPVDTAGQRALAALLAEAGRGGHNVVVPHGARAAEPGAVVRPRGERRAGGGGVGIDSGGRSRALEARKVALQARVLATRGAAAVVLAQRVTPTAARRR